MLKHRLFLGIAIVAVISVDCSIAQEYPKISEKALDTVFEQYVAALDNAQRVHEIGFQATSIHDVDLDEDFAPAPKNFRRYGMVADVGNGKFRRIENVGWSIGDVGISWEQGARLICNDAGAFMQKDPSAIRKIDKVLAKPGIRIHTQTIYSPFGLICCLRIGVGKGLATPTALTRLDKEYTLIETTTNGTKVECLYLSNNHLAGLVVVFDQKFGGMPIEIRSLWRDGKYEGTDKLKPIEKVDPREISRWIVASQATAHWTKLTDSKMNDFWVPAIVDVKERDSASRDRVVYYFVDWKIDKDVDQAIFDHKKFEKTKPNTIYAEVEISHEYIAQQKVLDEKVLALKKKFKLD
jgi:hypothetical protein